MTLHFSIDGEELVPAAPDCDSEQQELRLKGLTSQIGMEEYLSG